MADEGLFPIFVRQGNSRTRFSVGYIDVGGRNIIDPIFDGGTRFYEGLAAVKVESLWGLIDNHGDFVVEPKSWGWCRFREGLASISVRGKWGVIDRSGNFLVKPKYDYLEPFMEGLAAFKIGEGGSARYGFLNKSGAEAISARFHDARGFSEGLAAVRVGDLWGYINKSGVFQITPRFNGTGSGKRWPDVRAGYFVNGVAPVWSGPDQYAFIDPDGNFAFEGLFEDANSFRENRAVVKIDRRYGFIALDGKLVVGNRFSLVRDFSEGLARVQEQDARADFSPPSGFIDPEGQMLIAPQFHSAESFCCGLSLVTTEDSIGYVNRSGRFVWQGPYVDYGVLC
jgi:hypothetical protein